MNRKRGWEIVQQGEDKMTCRDTENLLELERIREIPAAEQQALKRHLASCHRCGETAKVARLSSVLLRTLREEIVPGPSFYARLRERIAAASGDQLDSTFLHAWGFARRLIPAVALGVLVLAGVAISLGGPSAPQQVQGAQSREIYAFSLEEVNLTGSVERPSQDQMLAFVLMQGEVRGAGSGE
jgi:hypothetical protein